MSGDSKQQCQCKHWFPSIDDREKCPLHCAANRPAGHDYWNGAKLTWSTTPIYSSQKPCESANPAPVAPAAEGQPGIMHAGPNVGGEYVKGTINAPSAPQSTELDAWAKRLAYYWPDSLMLLASDKVDKFDERVKWYRSELEQFSTAKDAQIVALTKERDEALAQYDRTVEEHHEWDKKRANEVQAVRVMFCDEKKRAEAAESRAERAEAENRKLREALEAIAKHADNSAPSAIGFTMGDLLSIRSIAKAALLTPATEKGTGDGH